MNLSYVWHGMTLTDGGVYRDSLFSVAGCDSVYELTLTVNPTYLVEENAEFAGDGSGFEWHDKTYYEAGEYVDTLVTKVGCDSVCTLHLSGTLITNTSDVRTIEITLVPNPVKHYNMAYIYADWDDAEKDGMIVETMTTAGSYITKVMPKSFPIEIDGINAGGTYLIRITTGTGNVYLRKLIVM